MFTCENRPGQNRLLMTLRRKGNCILIPVTLKLGVTFRFSLKYENLDHRKSEIFKQLTFDFCLVLNTKVLTTPVFDHPLLSPDVIILVENLDTVGKCF